MSKALVIIPTYNEIENISLMIRKVFSLAHPFDILVVDDNSPDGTASAVRSHMADFPSRLHLEVRDRKAGLGRAYVHGFRWGLANGYEYLFEMDADFSHNPDDLSKLYEACHSEADMVIGSRYVRGVNVVNWPLSRVLLSYFASVYVKLITGMKISDATAGFICYRRNVLESIGIDRIRFVGYAFQIEMKYRAYCRNFRLLEVPIVFTDRTRGTSKMSNAIIQEAVLGVIQLRWLRLTNRL